jgi:hypothetical protein
MSVGKCRQHEDGRAEAENIFGRQKVAGRNTRHALLGRLTRVTNMPPNEWFDLQKTKYTETRSRACKKQIWSLPIPEKRTNTLLAPWAANKWSALVPSTVSASCRGSTRRRHAQCVATMQGSALLISPTRPCKGKVSRSRTLMINIWAGTHQSASFQISGLRDHQGL